MSLDTGRDGDAEREMPINANKRPIIVDNHRVSRSGNKQLAPTLSGGALMHHYASQLVDLLLVLVAAWMVPATIFVIYAYFARLKNPVSESVFGRVVIVSLFIITTSIWLPIIVAAIVLSMIGHLWFRFRGQLRK
ncbi:hypothetical protein [Bradyrhizobium liaoningense]